MSVPSKTTPIGPRLAAHSSSGESGDHILIHDEDPPLIPRKPAKTDLLPEYLHEITAARYRPATSPLDEILSVRNSQLLASEEEDLENSHEERRRLKESGAPPRLANLPTSAQPSFPAAASRRPPPEDHPQFGGTITSTKARRLSVAERSAALREESENARARRNLLKNDNRRLQETSTTTLAPASHDGLPTYFPDDPIFADMNHMHDHEVRIRQGAPIVDIDMDAPEAWERWRGVAVAGKSKPLIVGVIDSGVDYHHEDLVDQVGSGGLSSRRSGGFSKFICQAA